MKNSKTIAIAALIIILSIIWGVYGASTKSPISLNPDGDYESTPNVPNDFIDYTNTRLSFSMKVPKVVDALSTSTIFDTEDSPAATTTGVVVLDNGTANTVYVVLQNDVYGTPYDYARVSDIESLDSARLPGWALHFVTIKNNADLLTFAKKFRDPTLCILGDDQTFEKMSDQSKTYDIRFHETPLADATCDDSDYHIFYSPKVGKLVWWNIGNGGGYFNLTVPPTTKYTLGKTFDSDMVESFKFIGQ